MNLYVTTQEIKDYMGISGTAQDTKLAMFNKMATDVVNGAVGASDLALHKVVDEKHYQSRIFDVIDPNIVSIEKIMDNGSEYTQDQDYDILLRQVKLDNYPLTAPREYFLDGMNPRPMLVTYVAGWNASGYAKITVTDYANIAATATIVLGNVGANDGFTLTRGTDWNPGSSNDDEASKIAVALNAKASIRAFASKNVVYVIEDTAAQTTGRTITVSDATRLALSSATLTGVNMPESIRLAVLMYIARLVNTGKNPTLRSYSIGGKSVTFATDSEFKQFSDLLQPYKAVGVKSI